MKQIFKTLRLFRLYMTTNLSAGMAYKSAFFIQFFGMILNNSAFILFWLILFHQTGSSIEGYTFQNVMLLWALTSSAFGVSAVLFGNAFYLSQLIYSGGLDVYLLQPKNVLLNLLASRTSISAWGDIFYGILLFFFTQSLHIHSIVLFTVFVLMAAIVLTAIRVIYHSFSFWLGNAEDFASTASELAISFMIYPGGIFKGIERLFLISLFPAVFLAYIPTELMTEFSLTRFLFLLGIDLLFVLLAIGVFNLGLKKYESGNKIQSRL